MAINTLIDLINFWLGNPRVFVETVHDQHWHGRPRVSGGSGGASDRTVTVPVMVTTRT